MRARLLVATLLVAVCTACFAAQTKPCDLMKMLQSIDAATVQKGISGFVALGGNAAVPLVCYLDGKAAVQPTGTGKLNAEKALVKIGSDALPAILEKLGTKSEELRVRLVRVLGQITDVRREEPLTKLWGSEKSDRVRGALVAAMTTFEGCDAPMTLSPRYALAGPLERQAMVVFFAQFGTDADLMAALDPAGERRGAILQGAMKALRALNTAVGKQGLARLQKVR